MKLFFNSSVSKSKVSLSNPIIIGTSWTQGSNGEYTQETTLDGILETDTPTIDLSLSDDISTAKSQIEAWSCISRITTSSGKITVYCYDLSPTIEIPIQIICIR